jgi:hypothetical protein
MSSRVFRTLAGMSGILGVLALGVYYSVPLPLPPANAGIQQIMDFGAHFHNRILFDTWLQAMGSFLAVAFFLAVIYMAKGAEKLSGWIAILGATLVLAMSLVDVALVLGAVQGAMNGHLTTALACFDLTFVFIHIFPLVPASATFLGLGTLLLGTHLLPRIFAYVALTLGAAFEVLGLVGLFNPQANAAMVLLLSSQEIWIVAAALALIFQAWTPSTSSAKAAS